MKSRKQEDSESTKIYSQLKSLEDSTLSEFVKELQSLFKSKPTGRRVWRITPSGQENTLELDFWWSPGHGTIFVAPSSIDSSQMEKLNELITEENNEDI